MTYMFLTLKLVLLTAGLLLLLVACLKLSEGKLKSFSKGKYVNVIEKTNLSKNNAIYVLKLGDEGVVLATNEKDTEKIKELTKEEVRAIEEEKENMKLEMNGKCNKTLNNTKTSISSLVTKLKGDK